MFISKRPCGYLEGRRARAGSFPSMKFVVASPLWHICCEFSLARLMSSHWLRFKSSGMLQCIVGWVLSDVLITTDLMQTSLSLSLSFRFKVSTCFRHHFPIFGMHYTNAVLVSVVCSYRCGLFSGTRRLVLYCTDVSKDRTVSIFGGI
jgi:hypothetical protein